MGHVPHVYVPGPWARSELEVSTETLHHLDRVLRLRRGEPVSYTDGVGVVGAGRWTGTAIERGAEEDVAPVAGPTIAVAPPRSTDRARFVVEKLGELGIPRLVWLATRRGRGRPPRPEKANAWAIGALEQSRGAWLMEIAGPLAWDELDRPLVVADPEGHGPDALGTAATIAVGPEGGFEADELPSDAGRVGLGERILRVETAAVVAATCAMLGVPGSPRGRGNRLD
ncbi:MAG TPA: hypothetical protein ENK55_06485 [Actinobacteria bacterium]|nr:hypothetical protein [Actinomycetota bacterium]